MRLFKVSGSDNYWFKYNLDGHVVSTNNKLTD